MIETSILGHPIVGPILQSRRERWLVTGVAGFIGSHLLESLLLAGQQVVGLDNFSTGRPDNLVLVRAAVGEEAWSHFALITGDIRDPDVCSHATTGIDVVLHQAALGSVPRSVADPSTSHAVNATGFLNMLIAARDAEVRRFVYASSSSAYGDSPVLPKQESHIGQPLSPYAVTKYANELYAGVFARQYGLSVTGLRYFNVYGPRQDPDGPYAAVIPKWLKSMRSGTPCVINGDGQTSRDFCFISNAVLANLLAGLVVAPTRETAEIFNVACGERTTLTKLHAVLAQAVEQFLPGTIVPSPQYVDFRDGDVRHSLADIDRIVSALGYHTLFGAEAGLRLTAEWYCGRHPSGSSKIS